MDKLEARTELREVNKKIDICYRRIQNTTNPVTEQKIKKEISNLEIRRNELEEIAYN